MRTFVAIVALVAAAVFGAREFGYARSQNFINITGPLGTVAKADRDGRITVWSSELAETPLALLEPPAFERPMEIEFLEGIHLASLSFGGRLTIYDTYNGKIVDDYKANDRQVGWSLAAEAFGRVAFCTSVPPNGLIDQRSKLSEHRVALVLQDDRWQTPQISWVRRSVTDGVVGIVRDLEFSSDLLDHTVLYGACGDGTVRCWDAETGRLRATYRGPKYPIGGLSICNGQIYALDLQGQLWRWSTTNQEGTALTKPNRRVDFARLAVRSEGYDQVLIGCLTSSQQSSGQVTVWRFIDGSGSQVAECSSVRDQRCLSFRPDGALYVGGGEEFVLTPD